MMKKLASAFLMVLIASPAFALTRAASPAKFSVPFASSAATGTGPGDATYPLPTASQIGIKNCAASLTDGFPPLSMTPVSGGGCAPFGQDFNGILKQITQWNQQTQAGAVPAYDSAYSSAIGGYPVGSILSQASTPSCFWISQVDNNSSDPDTGGANWTGNCPGGGAGGTSTGTANAQVITTTPFVVQGGARVCWTVGSGLTNTSSLQINVNSAGLVNVYQRTLGGLAALSGKEVQAGMIACATYDGTQYELDTSAANASLVNADQTLSGGANVTSNNLGTITSGTVTIDCGKSPLQYLVDGGTFTIAAPSNDGSCMLKITNTTGAQIPTFSGFRTNSNTGEPFDTTSGDVFFVTIVRIGGVSTYVNKSTQ
jgi:hypothetical protein